MYSVIQYSTLCTVYAMANLVKLSLLEDGTEVEDDDYLDHVGQHSILLAKLPGQGGRISSEE